MMYPDPIKIIEKYYPEDNDLRRLLIHHSRQVTDRALQIVDRHPELEIDREFVACAAMLHDLGIFLTDAPGIHCHGKEPYLLHGRLGAEIMRKEGYEDIARVCERHTGTGLTKENIIERHLPLPPQDFRPETWAEKLICYADKFYSKSHPEKGRSLEETSKSLEKFGDEGVKLFQTWAAIFEPEDDVK